MPDMPPTDGATRTRSRPPWIASPSASSPEVAWIMRRARDSSPWSSSVVAKLPSLTTSNSPMLVAGLARWPVARSWEAFPIPQNRPDKHGQ